MDALSAEELKALGLLTEPDADPELLEKLKKEVEALRTLRKEIEEKHPVERRGLNIGIVEEYFRRLDESRKDKL